MIIAWRSLTSTERTACQLLVQVLRPVVPDNAEPEYDVNLPNLCLSNLKAVHSSYSLSRAVRTQFSSYVTGMGYLEQRMRMDFFLGKPKKGCAVD